MSMFLNHNTFIITVCNIHTGEMSQQKIKAPFNLKQARQILETHPTPPGFKYLDVEEVKSIVRIPIPIQLICLS